MYVQYNPEVVEIASVEFEPRTSEWIYYPCVPLSLLLKNDLIFNSALS